MLPPVRIPEVHGPPVVLSSMVSESTQAIAVWSVLVVPFVLIALSLWTRRDLSLGFVAAYWFPPVVLTLIGSLPAPWQAVPG